MYNINDYLHTDALRFDLSLCFPDTHTHDIITSVNAHITTVWKLNVRRVALKS